MESFGVKEAVYVVLCGKAGECFLLVLVDAALDLVREADIQRAGFIAEYVDIIGSHAWDCSRNFVRTPDASTPLRSGRHDNGGGASVGMTMVGALRSG